MFTAQTPQQQRSAKKPLASAAAAVRRNPPSTISAGNATLLQNEQRTLLQLTCMNCQDFAHLDPQFGFLVTRDASCRFLVLHSPSALSWQLPLPVSAGDGRLFLEFSYPQSPKQRPLTVYGMQEGVGLLLCTETGYVRHWAHLQAWSVGRAHGDKFKETRLALNQGETVVLMRACPGSCGYFLLATSQGRLWSVSLMERGSSMDAVLLVMDLSGALASGASGMGSTTGNLLTKVSDWLTGSASFYSSSTSSASSSSAAAAAFQQYAATRSIAAVVSCPTGPCSRDIFVFSEMRVRQLSVEDRSESVHFVAQQTIMSDVRLAIAQLAGVSVHGVQAVVVDVQLAKESRLVLLVAYQSAELEEPSLAVVWLDRQSGKETHATSASQSRPLLFSIRLTYLLDPASLYPTDGDRTDDLLSDFHLLLANGGPVTFIHSSNVIILLCLNEIETYCEAIPFRAGVDGRIVTATTLTNRIGSLSSDPVSQLWLLYDPMGMLRLDVNLDKIFIPERPTTPTDMELEVQNERIYAHLKSQLEQAVFFGTQASNPIEFKIDRAYLDELGVAAAQLSLEILRGECKHLATGADTKRLLSERLHSMEELFLFLDRHGILEKLRPLHWWKIVTSMEKLLAAFGLWQYHSGLLGQQLTSSADKAAMESNLILERSVQEFLRKKGERLQGFTSIRKFFCSYLEEIYDVLVLILKTTEPLNLEWQTTSVSPELLVLECNELVKTSLDPVYRYRNENRDLMDTFEKKHRSWLGTVDLSNALYRQFELTSRAAFEFARIHQLDIVDSVLPPEYDNMDEFVFTMDPSMPPELILARLKSQLLSIGDYALHSHQELFNESGNIPRSSIEVAFAEITKKIVMSIAQVGLLNAAHEIAEKYHNYPSLIDLTHEYDEYPDQRLMRYVASYGDKFATAFYDWLIAKGDIRRLLSLDSSYNESLSIYLRSKGRRDLLWVHFVRCENFVEALNLLLEHIPIQKSLDQQEMMTSLAKLIFLSSSGANTDNMDTILSQPTARLCNSWLDLIACQKHYREKLNSILEKEYPHSVGSATDKANALTALLATMMKTKRPLLAAYFTTLTIQLLSGDVLSVDHLIDELTINFGDHLDDDDRYLLAAEMIAIAPNISDKARFELSRTILRRATLHSGSFFMHLGNQLDTQMAGQLRESLLFKLLQAFEAMNLKPFKAVTDLKAENVTAETVRSKHSNLKDSQIEDILTEYLQENILIDHLVQNYRLSMYYNEIVILLEQSNEMEE